MKAFFTLKKKNKLLGVAGDKEQQIALNLSNTVFDSNKQFQGGSFKRCVEYALTTENDKIMHAVLYCFRPFISASLLLDHVTTCINDASIMLAWSEKFNTTWVKQRVCKMLLDWISVAFFFDFQPDPKLVKKLHTCLESLLPVAEHNKIKLMLLKGKVDPHGLAFPDDNDFLRASAMSEELRNGVKFFLQQSPVDIATELSFIDYELYRSIEASELMNKNWQRENAVELSPNLVCLRKRFNQLSFWTITLVLEGVDSKTQQIRLVKQLLDCVWALYQQRNYNSLGALMSGLNSVSLTRLHYIWEGLSKTDLKRKDEINAVLEVGQNFKLYRQQLEEAGQNEVACIPYIPLHLRDMLAIYEREENFLKNQDSEGKQMVNFDKMLALGQTMHTILQFRGVQWKGGANTELREFVLRLPFMCEDDLLLLSDAWKGTEGDKIQRKEQNRERKLVLKAPVVDGHFLITVVFESWRIVLPCPVALTYKDLKKAVKGVCGKEVEMFYQTESMLTLALSSQEDLLAFLSHSATLMIDAILPRTTRITSRSRNSSNSGTMRIRPSSTSVAYSTNISNSTNISSSTNVSAAPSPSTLSQAVTALSNASNSNVPSVNVPEDAFSASPSNSRRRSLSVLLSQSKEDPLLSPTVSHSTPTSPRLSLFSAGQSPHMSPRADERKRIVVVELEVENVGEVEVVVPCSLTLVELLLVLQLMLQHDVLVFEKGKLEVTMDEGEWIKYVKSSKQKLSLVVKRKDGK